MKTFYPDMDGGVALNGGSRLLGRYNIIETDHPEIWSKRTFQFLASADPKSQTNFILSGFSNQGANVNAVCSGRQIQVKRQTAAIIPEGGDGKMKWTLDIEAHGEFYGNQVELHYRIFQAGAAVISGRILAKKMHP